MTTLQAQIDLAGGPLPMLRASSLGGFTPPIPLEHTNWRDEQRAWKNSAVLFDMSHHMTDVYFEGPDVNRLLSDVCINSFAGFGKNRAKQIVTCNEDGYVIGDSILFGLEPDRVAIVGTPVVSNWVTFQAEHGGYDVEISRDEATPFNPAGRRVFRYQLQGPNAVRIVAQASAGTLPSISFFHIGEFEIAGRPVRALSHTMSRTTGMEVFGPAEDGPAVLAELLAAGADFGLAQGGALALPTTALESGWVGVELPAIYSGEAMRPYREWLTAHTYEAMGSIGGSFKSDNIEDYYVTPWDLGYGRLIKFDHDFIGRAALERRADEPHLRQVWLRWNDEDVVSLLASSFFADTGRAKYLAAPYSVYCSFPFDTILADDRRVGMSVFTGYSVNVGSWSSLALVDEALPDGSDVSVVWGDEGSALVTVEDNTEKVVRATISRKPLV
ncbi:aminomethyltransferase family protein [Amycolatopsis pithecellobii]|uniref:Aminomethyl transferase family protein n=1 Tax=Amycolatopsis pithecellobii TaxID=664692 RepID=A0A6N7Z7M2_9PSEU|nr:aminomethyltransferase family protein [Amycolatopsis pithecellobii]MTD57281.1 aminomethyl transferase family protein [Amycolatopsis pithecellobii]